MAGLRCRILLDGPGLDLRVVRFSFREALSELYRADVVFETPDPELDLQALLGSPAFIHITTDDEPARTFSGVVEQAGYRGEVRHGLFHYTVQLVPRVFALSQRVRSRVFQSKTVKDIVIEVLTGAGIEPDDYVDWRLDYQDYKSREYCVQYKESELAFVSRLLAEEGMFFWFDHDDAGQRWVIADNPGVHAPIEPDVLYADNARAGSRELVTDIRFGTKVVIDAYMMRDWDWQSPSKPLESGAEGKLGLTHYAYPGGFFDSTEGGRHATDRLAAANVDKYRLRANTNHLGVAPGRTLELAAVRPGYLNRGFLVLSCLHSYTEGTAKTNTTDATRRGASPTTPTDHSGRDWAFTTSFVATHDDIEYRPALLPKPIATGVESAVIVSSGDEIQVDEWGRVKVHLHWDRENPLDDTASCYVRVQQQNLSGSMLLPRIGWEVSIGFLDGDPDRPVVLQKLYNRETLPPYPLPANLSQSALQSSSSPGGGGTNELRLQDASSGQGFNMHAQRDFTLGVGNNHVSAITVDTEETYKDTFDKLIGIDETVTITGGQGVTVQGGAVNATKLDKTTTVSVIDTLGVKVLYTTTVGGNRTETIGAAQDVRAVSMIDTFDKNHSQTIGGAIALTAAKTVSDTVAGSKLLTIGGAYLIKATAAFAETGGAAKQLIAGAVLYDAGGAMALSAKKALQITVGGAWAEKVKTSYGLAGKKVEIKAPGGAELKGGGTKLVLKDGKLELDGSKVGMKGQIMLSIKGKISYQ